MTLVHESEDWVFFTSFILAFTALDRYHSFTCLSGSLFVECATFHPSYKK